MNHLFTIIVEIGFLCCLFINAILFLPQVRKIIKHKSSEELSLTTFAGFNVIQIFAVLYGVIHHDYILIIGNLLSLITCGAITLLIIWYSYINRR